VWPPGRTTVNRARWGASGSSPADLYSSLIARASYQKAGPHFSGSTLNANAALPKKTALRDVYFEMRYLVAGGRTTRQAGKGASAAALLRTLARLRAVLLPATRTLTAPFVLART